MKLSGTDGMTVVLRPVRMQFPGEDWLVVAGDVRLADGRVWAFEQACLTVSEARSMGEWLRSVGEGSVQPAPFRADSFDGLEWCTEPNLGLSLAGLTEGEATVRVHFSLEALPPWRVDDDDDFYSYFELVRMSLVDLLAAADQWDRDVDVIAPSSTGDDHR